MSKYKINNRILGIVSKKKKKKKVGPVIDVRVSPPTLLPADQKTLLFKTVIVGIKN